VSQPWCFINRVPHFGEGFVTFLMASSVEPQLSTVFQLLDANDDLKIIS
jgi:hypothetical protein